MEDLNKTQVVLLTLFITFVTSVTTGIVTVTLLQQAPQNITQTINRVVEKVTPGKTEIKQTTILVRQEDEIIQTAATLKPAIARIILLGEVAAATVDPSLSGIANQAALGQMAIDQNNKIEIGTGLVVSADGLVATTYSVIPDQSASYGIVVGNKEYSANVVTHSKNDGLTILRIIHDTGIKFFVPQFTSKPVTLGQTVIALGRDLERYTVSVGIVSSAKDATLSSLPSFKTTVKTDETNIGGPLLNSDGLLIGLNMLSGNAIPTELIKSYISNSNGSTTKSTASPVK